MFYFDPILFWDFFLEIRLIATGLADAFEKTTLLKNAENVNELVKKIIVWAKIYEIN